MDKLEMAQLKGFIKAAIRETLEAAEERWVSDKVLMEQFQMFNKDFMKKYADRLPRQRVEYTDKDGIRRGTHWAYPVHKIQRMIEDGSIKDL